MEHIVNAAADSLIANAGTRLIQSTLPPHVQQRIASRLAPPLAKVSESLADIDADLLPPIDFDVPTNYAQARLLLQHKVVRPGRQAFRKVVFDLGAWVTSDSTQQSALGTIVFTVITIVLFVLAAVTYAIFYAAYMPNDVTRVPAYLSFQDSISVSTFGVQFPEAVVDFTSKTILPQHTLRPDQHYTIGVELRVPDAPTNYEPGNFMISLNLTAAGSPKNKNSILASSKRPALVAYKSMLLRSLETIYRAFSLINGWTHEGQTIRTLMIDDYVEREDMPLNKASLKIHTAAVQIQACYITLAAHFQGLRFFMHDWFYTTAALFIIFFMFWYALLGVLLWRMFVSWFEAKANQRTMRKVTKKRVNEEGVEEEYESEEEVFSDEEEIANEDMLTRVRVDLGRVLKTTSTAVSDVAGYGAAAANSVARAQVPVTRILADPSDSTVRQRKVFTMDSLDEGAPVGDGEVGYPVPGGTASPPRSSSLQRDADS
ncbi:putative adipose-regulatory protein-domain-containing protein [Chytriomyces sp. MP71]|nr:putative adipose-regulatory protein-domain-containing protein [Chytriomyces sp. MP71]